MPQLTLICHNCGHGLEIIDRLTYNATCDKCAAHLRCCLSCRFYDETAYNECREPQAERVREKDRANHCGYFEVTSGLTGKQQNARRDDALKKLNDLFGKK